MTVWMREDGNAALLLAPHPCNTDKHHAGDISAHGRYYCEGLHAAQTKSTHSSSNLEPLGRTALHSEPKQSMILNKPVIEKSTFVPFSITVSSKEIQTLKHLNYFSQIVCMYIVPIPAWNILIQSLFFCHSPTFTSQALCVGSVLNSSQAKILSVEALFAKAWEETLDEHIQELSLQLPSRP